MKAFVLALLVLLTVGLVAASAKPGDPIAVRGTLAWPAALANEPFVLVQADDGRVFYVDVTAAQRRGKTGLRAGERVSFTGVEGGRPYETAAVILGSDETAFVPLPSTTTDPAASPRTESLAPPVPPAAAPPAAGASPYERILGTVQSFSGHTLILRREDGQTVDVDVSRLDGRMAREVRPGQRVMVFGTTEGGRRLTAVGFIISEPGSAPSSRPSR